MKKGGTVHRRSGMLFVYAMVVMGATASILEFFRSAGATNIVAALMSIYFVGTALTTVRRPSPWTRAINLAALAIALGLAVLVTVGGVQSGVDDGPSAQLRTRGASAAARIAR